MLENYIFCQRLKTTLKIKLMHETNRTWIRKKKGCKFVIVSCFNNRYSHTEQTPLFFGNNRYRANTSMFIEIKLKTHKITKTIL